jgi:hypothetical protein
MQAKSRTLLTRDRGFSLNDQQRLQLLLDDLYNDFSKWLADQLLTIEAHTIKERPIHVLKEALASAAPTPPLQ